MVSGGKVELVLGIRPCRGDGRRARRQADTLQIALDRTWIGESSHYFHVAATGGALGNLYSKNSPEEVSPGQAVPALGGGILGMRTGVRFGGLLRPRYDLCPAGGVGRQDAMIAHQVEAPWRYQGSQFLYQFLRRELNSIGAGTRPSSGRKPLSRHRGSAVVPLPAAVD